MRKGITHHICISIIMQDNLQTDLKLYGEASAHAPGSHHVLKDVYGFFGTSLSNSVAVYVGVPNWKQDLQLLETYAIPTIVCDPFGDDPEWSMAILERRGKIMDWMNFLKDSGCGTHFVNPKWIEPVIEYPGVFNGSRDLGPDTVVRMSSWDSLLERAYALRKRPEQADAPEIKFAVCKIELYQEEITILASLLASKYRPSLLYVRWSESPDESQLYCEAAGHLQSSGYRLISTNVNGFFIYHYSGEDIYSCCSWMDVSMTNPIMNLIKDEVQKIIKEKYGGESEVKPDNAETS